MNEVVSGLEKLLLEKGPKDGDELRVFRDTLGTLLQQYPETILRKIPLL